LEGKIKKIMTQRGFGFISLDEGKDIFFHCSGLKDVDLEDLKEGDAVSFEVEEDSKGPRAVNVERAGKEEDNGEE
jgi:CspA family cold shock protein